MELLSGSMAQTDSLVRPDPLAYGMEEPHVQLYVAKKPDRNEFQSNLTKLHAELTDYVESHRFLKEQYKEQAPSPGEFILFHERALSYAQGKSLRDQKTKQLLQTFPTVRKLFLYHDKQAQKRFVEQEIWFSDKQNPDSGNALKQYMVLHVHHDKERQNPEEISPDEDLVLVNQANARNLAEPCSSNIKFGKHITKKLPSSKIAEWMLTCPYEKTLISSLTLQIFPPPSLKTFKPRWNWKSNAEGYGEFAEKLSDLLDISSNVDFWDTHEARRQLMRGPGAQQPLARFHKVDISKFLRTTKSIHALCIGIGDYEEKCHCRPNCCNDAAMFRDHLEQLDANVVPVIGKVTRSAFVSEITQFVNMIEASERVEIVICYVAAHGVEIEGQLLLLPSEFDFRMLDEYVEMKRTEDAQEAKVKTTIKEICESAYPVHRLISRIDNACSALQKRTSNIVSPIRLFLLDCCREIPEVVRTLAWQQRCELGEDFRDFNKLNGMLAFSCHSGQQSPDGKNEHSPFAVEMAKNLFDDRLPLDQAVIKAYASLKPMADFYGGYMDHFFFGENNRLVLLKPLVKTVQTSLSEQQIGSIQNKTPRHLEDLQSQASTGTNSSYHSEAESLDDEASLEMCAAYNDGPIDEWQTAMGQLLETLSEKYLRHPSLMFIFNFMRMALKEEHRGLWGDLCTNKWKKSPDFDAIVKRFKKYVTDPSAVDHPITSKFFSESVPQDNAVKFIMNEFLKSLIENNIHELDYWREKFDGKVTSSKVSDINFLKLIDKELVKTIPHVKQTMLKSSFAARHGSFTVFFKASRRIVILLFELLLCGSADTNSTLHSHGFRSLASSWAAYGPISLCNSVEISTESKKKLGDSLRSLARLRTSALRLLMNFVEAQPFQVTTEQGRGNFTSETTTASPR